MSVLIGIAVSALIAYLFVRVLGSVISWRVFLLVLVPALLIVSYGINTTPATAELGHLLTNLFGGNA